MYRFGDFIRPVSPTLILTGKDFFDPFEVDFLERLAGYPSLLHGDEEAPKNDIHSSEKTRSKKMTDLREIIIANTGTLPHIVEKVLDPLYTVHAYGVKYSVSRIRDPKMDKSETRMYNCMEAVNDMVRPDAAVAIERMNSFFERHYEVWRDIIELIDKHLSKYFEPILEFIASPDGIKLYEVKEKTHTSSSK